MNGSSAPSSTAATPISDEAILLVSSMDLAPRFTSLLDELKHTRSKPVRAEMIDRILDGG
jgi:hypothetical protein